jgi:hypothetical protein
LGSRAAMCSRMCGACHSTRRWNTDAGRDQQRAGPAGAQSARGRCRSRSRA